MHNQHHAVYLCGKIFFLYLLFILKIKYLHEFFTPISISQSGKLLSDLLLQIQTFVQRQLNSIGHYYESNIDIDCPVEHWPVIQLD